MTPYAFNATDFDRSNPLAIYAYSGLLIGNSLHGLIGSDNAVLNRKGKGSLGQLVEELFFGYEVNSKREADFQEAGLEIKCTPLLESRDGSYRIKERLVCTMIDYAELIRTPFNESHLISKCRLMLLLFYLHKSGVPSYNFQFLFRVLWNLPPKDLKLIQKDYETIADKVRKGEAHLLSEGDTLYLGACRKGQKNDRPQPQPNSEIKAFKRAFSLKPAYMRYILSHVVNSGQSYYSNYQTPKVESGVYEMVNEKDLESSGFEQIILKRFRPFIGKNYIDICNLLGVQPYQSKSKYADIAGLIASDNKSKRPAESEEFVKSGLIMKTIRLRTNGMPQEAMSFKNIDYIEIAGNDEWIESETYEIFTSRFLFVVFKPLKNEFITIHNHRQNSDITEPAYILDNVFFWTMPPEDLTTARDYWTNIRQNVINNRIHSTAFWSISDNKKFHVRPKATSASQRTVNPNGGLCDKYAYWFNASYIKHIIDSTAKNV